MLDPAFFAATLGLPFDLVKGFFDISLILRSGLPIDPALLWALCAEVKRLYFETAPWAYIKVINVGSDTFGNPIFQKGLQN